MFLVEEIAGREDVIKCKKNTADSNKKKNQAWKEIADVFSARYCESARDPVFFKKKWENMVSNAKKWSVGNRMRELSKTGGGPPPTEPPAYIKAVAEMHERSDSFVGVGRPIESGSTEDMSLDDETEQTGSPDAEERETPDAGSASKKSLEGTSGTSSGTSQKRPAASTCSATTNKARKSMLDDLHAEVLRLEKGKLLLEKRKLRLECYKLKDEIALLRRKAQGSGDSSRQSLLTPLQFTSL